MSKFDNAAKARDWYSNIFLQAAKIVAGDYQRYNEQTGKWVVRQAFEGCLPDHIIYQTKRFFAQGSGVAYIMRSMAEKLISPEELDKFNRSDGHPFLSSVEELYYYREFKKTFPQPCFDRLVGRWDPLRPDFFRRIVGQ